MKYWIIDREGGLGVRIEDIEGQEQALVDKVRRCRESAWACPSGECRNVASIEERVEGGRLFLTLVPRAGAQIDRAGITECLRYLLLQRGEA